MAFLSIITDNILPLILFVAIGYLMDRQFHLNVASLTKLTFTWSCRASFSTASTAPSSTSIS